MKLKLILIFFIMVLMMGQVCFGATKYLRSGGGNWGTNETWSTTSNGSADTTAPSSGDDVICDPNSSTATLTINQAVACKSLTMTGFVGTLTGNFGISNYGNMIFGTGTNVTMLGTITMCGDSNLNGAGLTLTCPIGINGSGKTVTLTNDLNLGTKGLTVTQGTFSTSASNYSITCGTFSSTGSNTKTITLGSSTVTCTSLDLSGTNLTFNYDTSTIILNQSATGAMSFSPGTAQFYNLTLNGFNDKLSTLSLASDLTVNNTLSLQGNSITNRLWVKSSVTGTPRTLTATAVTLSYCDWQDIVFAGAATWSGTSVGNCGGNTGSMTYTTPVSRFWVKATTNGSGSYSDPNHWAGTSGGAGGQTVPLCHDSVYFDPNSIAAASQTITCDMPRIGSIDFTGVSNTPALSLNTNPNYYFGSVTFPSTMTFSIAGVPGFNLENRNNFNITINPTLNTNIYFNNYGATATILSDITCRSFSVNAGTVNLNNKNINSSYGFNPPGTITRVVNMGSGIYTSTTPYTWNITGATTGLTFNCDTSTLVFPAVYSFYGIGLTYYKVKNTSTGALTITGNNTFNTLESDPNSGSNQITLTASSNQTVSNLIASNTSATKTVTIASSDPNTAATLTKSSGIVCLKHTNINKVTATGGATFLVDQNSNLTNATGWTKMDETYPTFNSIGQRFNEANQTFYGNYGFQPPSIAGCKLWLDASRITGLSDGNSVTTWTDLSGNGNNATQSDPNLAPIYKVNIQNGLPAVRSDGINDRMSLINLLNSQTKSTVFLVVIPRKTTLYDSMFGQGVSNGFACYFQNDATTKFFHGGYNKVSGATTIGQCALLRMMCDGTNITNSLNNASSSPANSYGANTGTDTLSLFSMSGATYPSQVDICEIAIWNTDLTAGQITQLNTYFSRKYNLTLTP